MAEEDDGAVGEIVKAAGERCGAPPVFRRSVKTVPGAGAWRSSKVAGPESEKPPALTGMKPDEANENTSGRRVTVTA